MGMVETNWAVLIKRWSEQYQNSAAILLRMAFWRSWEFPLSRRSMYAYDGSSKAGVEGGRPHEHHDLIITFSEYYFLQTFQFNCLTLIVNNVLFGQG
jgi:hypothetical protein